MISLSIIQTPRDKGIKTHTCKPKQYHVQWTLNPVVLSMSSSKVKRTGAIKCLKVCVLDEHKYNTFQNFEICIALG